MEESHGFIDAPRDRIVGRRGVGCIMELLRRWRNNGGV